MGASLSALAKSIYYFLLVGMNCLQEEEYNFDIL